MGGGYRDVALCVCLCDLGVLSDLLDVVDTHVLDGSGIVLEVLDVEVDDLDAELLHVGDDVFGYLLCDALSVLNHFLEADRADDLAHITLKHLCDKADKLCLTHSEKRLGCALEQCGVGRHLYVGDAVNAHVDELVCRDSLGGLDIDLHYSQRELVDALEEGHSPAGFTDEYSLLSETGDDVRRVRRCLQISAEKEDNNDDGNDSYDGQVFHFLSLLPLCGVKNIAVSRSEPRSVLTAGDMRRPPPSFRTRDPPVIPVGSKKDFYQNE